MIPRFFIKTVGSRRGFGEESEGEREGKLSLENEDGRGKNESNLDDDEIPQELDPNNLIFVAIFEASQMFNIFYVFFATLTTIGFLDSGLADDIFVIHVDGVTNATNANVTNATGVIDVNEEFVIAVNRSLFPFFTIFLPPVIRVLGKMCKFGFDLSPEAGAHSGTMVPWWACIIVVIFFFAGPFGGAVVAGFGFVPDLVTAFNIPDTWFVPGKEEEATSLGLALTCLIFAWFPCLVVAQHTVCREDSPK